MIIRRQAKDTLTPIELFHGETFQFRTSDENALLLELLDTGAAIMSTTLKQPGVEERRAKTTYRFWADVRSNGTATRLEREVGTQQSFYEPWVFDGVRVWLDAVDAIFDFMNETHGPCRLTSACSHRHPPRKQARLAVQEVGREICPEKLHPWCPLPPEGLKIEQCYRGEDCWMGAYDGASAHGGLDINHPQGTPLYAPFDLHYQFLVRSVADGYFNNSWRGIRRWDNGSEWVILSAHMTRLLVPEHKPLERGVHYAEGAGVRVGAAQHSHFTFLVHDMGESYLLDPWILFWQMYRDQDVSRD